MNKTEYIKWLKQFNPCSEALKWTIETEYKTAEEAWALCDRPHWLMWIARRVVLPEPGSPERREMTKCVCECLELIKHLMPDESKDCFEQLKLWADGEDGIDLAKIGWRAHKAYYKAVAAYDASAFTASAAYAAAVDAAATAYAVAAYDYAVAAAADASPESKLEMCNIIRKYYKINDLIERVKSGSQ